MHMIDFEYDGERLSNYGLMICGIDSSSDEIVDIGNNRLINKIKSINSEEYMITSSSYEDIFNTEFQVIKTGCNSNDEVITDIELHKIVRWLNRGKYCIFKPIYDDDESFMNVYYKGTFNVKAIKVGVNVVGLSLSFVANAPFGFSEKIKYTYSFKSKEDSFAIYDTSDEIGYLYCDTEITCLENGDLKINNTLDPNNEVVVKNCKEGEVIKLLGKQKIIQTSLTNHTAIYNDFNYNFLRIKNTYEDSRNKFSSSIRCNIVITYSPIRKVGIVI